jgi:hypothetical protein
MALILLFSAGLLISGCTEKKSDMLVSGTLPAYSSESTISSTSIQTSTSVSEGETESMAPSNTTVKVSEAPATSPATSKSTTATTTAVSTTTPSTTAAEVVHPFSEKSAGETVDVSALSASEIADSFYYVEISDEVFARMDGKSFKADCTTKRSSLRYVRVLHIGFDGMTHIGELVVNKKIAENMIDIFSELYSAGYKIEKMHLVDDYGADDNLSMADNNTSSFNFRWVNGSSTLSRHALGMAIDINPLYNPWIYELDGVPVTDPPGGAPYIDRTVDCEYIIDHDDLFYQLMIDHGFTWGGDWSTSKDYQHFSKAS